MTEQDYLYLLARAYMAMRLEYITSRIKPVYMEVRDTLDAVKRLPQSVENTTDSDIREAFMPRLGVLTDVTSNGVVTTETVDLSAEVSATRKPSKKSKGE